MNIRYKNIKYADMWQLEDQAYSKYVAYRFESDYRHETSARNFGTWSKIKAF